MSFEALLAKLDPRPDRRGREFERICAWYLRNAPEYRSQVRKVWLWNDWPGRWAADAGIDLVAETVAGDLWAVQAKAYDPAYAIKKSDIDSFLSESSRPHYSYRLLIATTDRIGPTARRTLSGQEKPAGLLLRSQLALAEADWPKSPADLRPRAPRRKRPRPHQRKAVNAVVRGFRDADRGQLVMACGTGKTLAACFLAEKLKARRVLVLVPSLSLLAQSLREWGSAIELDYLAVCSDETVAGQDAVVASTSELGIPVTTNPAAITAFMSRRGERMRVVFATYQSSPRIAEAQKTRTPAFDLVIADEAHRCAGPEAGVFATVLNPKKIKASRRLFMTATPRYYTGRVRKEARDADLEIASMDDESRFGRVLHRLSFAEAIDQRLLSDYQVAVVGVSDATYREYAERGVFVTADGETVTDARTLASQLGLLRAMANYNLSRVVTFHSRIRSASAFARSLPEVCAWLPADRRPEGTLWADHVSGEMPSGERDIRLNRLRAVKGEERGVLTNARCLAEGVDVPTLDGVAFIEPRRSQVDVVQAVGRAIRKAEDKTMGTVVIPVFVDEGADPETALEGGEFDRVWQIVKALRAHDEDLAEELDELRRELGRRARTAGRPEKIQLDLPVAVGDAFVRAFDTRLVTETTASWEFYFGLLLDYVARIGNGRVPSTHRVEDGYRLGGWVRTQRKLRHALSPERTQRLESVPGWTWDPFADAWESKFAAVQTFLQRGGSGGFSHMQQARPALYAWVMSQRGAYRDGELADDRTARLQAIPGWVWERQDTWEANLALLVRFAEREGHAQVPFTHVEGTTKLGHWVFNLRQRRRKGRLTGDEITSLESLPSWSWHTKADAWERGFGALEQFIERTGSARVPHGHTEGGFQLWAWIKEQRRYRVEGKLRTDRAIRLEALPGWSWSPRGEAWDIGYDHLRRFAERKGHARVPTNWREDGYNLGNWVGNQRQFFARGELEPGRISLLESLPGWLWNTRVKEAAGSGTRPTA